MWSFVTCIHYRKIKSECLADPLYPTFVSLGIQTPLWCLILIVSVTALRDTWLIVKYTSGCVPRGLDCGLRTEWLWVAPSNRPRLSRGVEEDTYSIVDPSWGRSEISDFRFFLLWTQAALVLLQGGWSVGLKLGLCDWPFLFWCLQLLWMNIYYFSPLFSLQMAIVELLPQPLITFTNLIPS